MRMRKVMGLAVGVVLVTLILVSSIVYGLPGNDDCPGAVAVAVPSVTLGDTSAATADTGLPDCEPYGFGFIWPGIWYKVTGNGRMLTASTCSDYGGSMLTHDDTQISVFSGDCANLICVDYNDDNCPSDVWASTVEWCSQPGETYYVLVHGCNYEVGEFELSIFDSGPCPSVGGLVLPLDRLALVAPWAGLVGLAALGGLGVAWLRRRRA